MSCCFYQLAQRVPTYLSDIRASKEPFQLSEVLTIVREVSSSAINAKNASSWAAVADLLGTLNRAAAEFLPAAMEANHVVKSESYCHIHPGLMLTGFI